MLYFRSTSHIDHMLLNLANGIAKEHSDVFFCSVTQYQGDIIRLQHFSIMTIHHSEGDGITGVCRIDHINTKWRLFLNVLFVTRCLLQPLRTKPTTTVASAAACKPCSAESASLEIEANA
jgi:hypothetical protein